MKRFIVFYANRHHADMDLDEIRALHQTEPEVWQGAFIYDRVAKGVARTGWIRADLTPCLIEDVPKPTRLMKLLID